MKVLMVSVYDSKVEIYGSPSFLLNRGSALRGWERLANDKNTDVGQNPQDYTLFEIGEWDDVTGIVTMLPAKVSLGNALEFVGNNGRPSIPLKPTDLTPNGAQ